MNLEKKEMTLKKKENKLFLDKVVKRKKKKIKQCVFSYLI